MNKVVNLVTIGVEKWGYKIYRIAVHGDTMPHLHIYLYNDTYPRQEFDFEISLIDILCKDEINLISQVDRIKNISNRTLSDCSWTGYEDIKNGIRNFLFSKSADKHFSDNLELTIYAWSKETDFVKTECEGQNLMPIYFMQSQLTPLPKYEKYLCHYNTLKTT